MPFGLGVPELCLILGILVLLFGGKKFAELGKGMGQAIGGFKKALREGKEAEKEVMNDPVGEAPRA